MFFYDCGRLAQTVIISETFRKIETVCVNLTCLNADHLFACDALVVAMSQSPHSVYKVTMTCK